MSLDERVLRVVRTWGHTPEGERVVAGFSRLAEHAAVWLAIGFAGGAIDARRRERWGRATATVATTYALNTAIKLAVRRRRPELKGLPPLASAPTRLSFPSAHASTSFAGALAYAQLGLPAPPLYALATGLALSRVYLGLHYPSDVLAGALLGTAVAAARGGGGQTAAASPNGYGPVAATSNGHGPLRPAGAAGGRL
ncbi:MAG TPA: phosphatase PAP2 family protein [Solirubrobacteraceae bacterium]|nr:phosphatase PAP2 family protein [Solirubrobacteraceae bacterium]